MSDTMAMRTAGILAHGPGPKVGYTAAVKVSDLGEFGLIDRLAELLAARDGVAISERLFVGIGDDAAVWLADDRALIATTDTLVEGVHFLPERTPWRDLGWKALAVNVSDVAAMGGRSEFALVTLGLSERIEAEQIDELYRGLADAAEAFGVVIAGGDIARSENVFVTVALCGRAELDQHRQPVVLRRGGAKEGDLLAVTGRLGGAAGGLRLLRDGKPAASDPARSLLERHRRPQPRASVGAAAAAAGLRCAIDISDGLLQDLGHVCKSSRLGAVVWRDKVPLEPALAELFPDEALQMATAGGEDYELLLAGQEEQLDALRMRIDVPLTVVGELVIDARHEAKLLDESGREVEVSTRGWDHLRGRG
jgi:thiamine-monophosphate kinase